MTNMKFTPEEFYEYKRSYEECLALSARANNRLHEIKAAWLEELKKNAVRVYGNGDIMIGWNGEQVKSDTHSALLIGITELPKAKCEHHTITVHLGTESHGTWYECKKCDKRLKANWETI